MNSSNLMLGVVCVLSIVLIWFLHRRGLFYWLPNAVAHTPRARAVAIVSGLFFTGLLAFGLFEIGARLYMANQKKADAAQDARAEEQADLIMSLDIVSERAFKDYTRLLNEELIKAHRNDALINSYRGARSQALDKFMVELTNTAPQEAMTRIDTILKDEVAHGDMADRSFIKQLYGHKAHAANMYAAMLQAKSEGKAFAPIENAPSGYYLSMQTLKRNRPDNRFDITVGRGNPQPPAPDTVFVPSAPVVISESYPVYPPPPVHWSEALTAPPPTPPETFLLSPVPCDTIPSLSWDDVQNKSAQPFFSPR